MYGFAQASKCRVGGSRQWLAMTPIDVHRSHTSLMRSVDITPPVPDHDAPGEIESEPIRRRKNHSGLRFAAVAVVGVVVSAHDDLVDRQRRAQPPMDLVEVSLVQGAPGDVGLVGDDDQHQTGFLQRGEGLRNAFENAKVVGSRRRQRCSVDDA